MLDYLAHDLFRKLINSMEPRFNFLQVRNLESIFFKSETIADIADLPQAETFVLTTADISFLTDIIENVWVQNPSDHHRRSYLAHQSISSSRRLNLKLNCPWPTPNSDFQFAIHFHFANQFSFKLDFNLFRLQPLNQIRLR